MGGGGVAGKVVLDGSQKCVEKEEKSPPFQLPFFLIFPRQTVARFSGHAFMHGLFPFYEDFFSFSSSQIGGRTTPDRTNTSRRPATPTQGETNSSWSSSFSNSSSSSNGSLDCLPRREKTLRTSATSGRTRMDFGSNLDSSINKCLASTKRNNSTWRRGTMSFWRGSQVGQRKKPPAKKEERGKKKEQRMTRKQHTNMWEGEGREQERSIHAEKRQITSSVPFFVLLTS